MLATSQVEKLDAHKSGYLANIEFEKQGGWWRLDTSFNVLSPDFEINDIGYAQRGDMMRWFYDLMFKKEQPFSIFREGHRSVSTVGESGIMMVLASVAIPRYGRMVN